jgi:hypothetical protein
VPLTMTEITEEEEDVVESIFSEHWTKLATLLSEDAKKALQEHLDAQPTTKTPTATPAATPREAETVEGQLRETAVTAEKDVTKTVASEKDVTKTVASHNSEFGRLDYWEKRFEVEQEYDWLLTFDQVKASLLPYLADETYGGKKARILLVGVGNSSFSADLYDAGYTNLVNVDYSGVVIEKMKKLHEKARPNMQWRCMDMTDLQFDEVDMPFDIVIDKAAMDAIMVDEGDVWDPSEAVIVSADKCCECNKRVLKEKGALYIMISFMQPHFRTKYLSGVLADRRDAESLTEAGQKEERKTLLHEGIGIGQTVTGISRRYGWTLSVEEITLDGGSLGNFLYVMRT